MNEHCWVHSQTSSRCFPMRSPCPQYSSEFLLVADSRGNQEINDNLKYVVNFSELT